jgi:hypothetical protein
MGVMSVTYHDVNALAMSPEIACNALEHLMATKYEEPFSKLGLSYYGQGEEKGLFVGERGTVLMVLMVLMVLKARGLRVSDSQRDPVDACDDLNQLKGWAEAALTAETADEVFR